MIKIVKYEVVNGEKSSPYFIDKEFNTEKEVEDFRRKLERKHRCFKKTPFGEEKVKQILFYRLKVPKEIRRFLYGPPKKGKIVKVYMTQKKAKYGIIESVSIVNDQEVAILKECDAVPVNKVDYFLDSNKVIFKD